MAGEHRARQYLGGEHWGKPAGVEDQREEQVWTQFQPNQTADQRVLQDKKPSSIFKFYVVQEAGESSNSS